MSDKLRVGRTQDAIALVHGGAVTTVSTTRALNGVLWHHKVKIGPVDASATATLNIIDADNDMIYTKAAIAGNATTLTNLTGDNRVPLAGTYTIQIVFSAAQTATDNTITVTLTVDKG